MENRKRLHESGVVMIMLGIFNLFMFLATIVKSIIDGTVDKALAGVEADLLGAVKVGLVIVCVLMSLFVLVDVFLGIKAIKVSKNPTAGRGYIIVAFIFCILGAIAVISNAISIFSGHGYVLDSSLNLGTTAFSVCMYAWLIRSAEAVRKDVLNGTK